MGSDLKPDLSAPQVKVLFTKRYNSYLFRKNHNVYKAGPFVFQGVKTEPVICQVATRVDSLGITLCTQLPSSQPLG